MKRSYIGSKAEGMKNFGKLSRVHTRQRKRTQPPPPHYGNGSPSSALNTVKRGRGLASTKMTDRNLNRHGSSRPTRPSNFMSYSYLVRERNYLQLSEFFDEKCHVYYSTHDFALLNISRICKSTICKFQRHLNSITVVQF